MLVEFSIVPVGEGTSISAQVAEAVRIVEESGLPYRVNPMGTVVEGTWDETIGVVRKCHEALMKHADRVLTSVEIDDRKGRTGTIERKIKSVEEKIGHALRTC
jgi:uncharacterized protein (TIGR00106 family)